MKRFLRKAALWLARIGAVLVILLILFYAEEDWRGARDWAACQRDLAAKGESLDLRQLAPPGKPEDDLSKVPIFAEVNQKPPKRLEDILLPDTSKPTRLDQINTHLRCEDSDKYPKDSSYLAGRSIDLVAWQKFYRALPAANLPGKVGTPAEDILQALSQFDPEWNEISVAVSNPNAYWPVDYEKPFEEPFGGINSMIHIAKILPLKAASHLDNHQADLAEKDYLFSFCLNHSLSKGCFAVSYLVMVGVRAIDDAVLWEGLHRHAWNDAQLREMESALASTDMLALGADCLRNERAICLQTMKFSQVQNPHQIHGGEIEHYVTDTLSLLRLRPSGWWDEDRRHYSLGVQNLIEAIDLPRGILNRPVSVNIQNDPSQRSFWPLSYIPVTELGLPNLSRIITRPITRAETYRRLARLACRLEEYRIAHGQYPEKLDDLPDLPAHLNQEVLSEQPLRYQRKGDGYLLYSLGWNQKDDGGVNFLPQPTPNNNAPQEADWVWPSP